MSDDDEEMTALEKLSAVNRILNGHVGHEEEDGLTPELMTSLEDQMLSKEGIKTDRGVVYYVMAIIWLAVKRQTNLPTDNME